MEASQVNNGQDSQFGYSNNRNPAIGWQNRRDEMTDKVKVQVTIRARWQGSALVEMDRAQHAEFQAQLDARPRGFKAEQLAQEIMDAAEIDLRHGDIDDFEVEDFYIDDEVTEPAP
jgi:hypothetical protein